LRSLAPRTPQVMSRLAQACHIGHTALRACDSAPVRGVYFLRTDCGAPLSRMAARR